MKVATLILASIGALSLALIAWLQIVDSLTEPAPIADSDLVWCDANKGLVGLAADTLALLPEDLAGQAVNVQRDDPHDQLSNLDDLTVLDALRLVRAVAQDVPPQQLEGIGYPTEAGFEDLHVLGPRALSQSARLVKDWLEQLEGGWDHPDTSRACLAAVSAFR